MVAAIIGDTDEVKADVAAVGDLVEVHAPGTPGGYTWRLAGLSNGLTLVRTAVGEDPYAQLPAGVSRPVGGVLDSIFVFAPTAVGQATATLLLVRPWTPAAPIREVVVEVETSGGVRAPKPAPAPFGGAKPGPFVKARGKLQAGSPFKNKTGGWGGTVVAIEGANAIVRWQGENPNLLETVPLDSIVYAGY